MDIEVNKLIKYMSDALFRVRHVYHYNIPPKTESTHTAAPMPGFVFPVSGAAQFHINDTPYLISPGTVLHGMANSTMHKRVVGNYKWEYIAVLYEPFRESSIFKLSNSHFTLNIGQNVIINELLRQLENAYNRPDDLSVFQVDTLFRRILEEMFISSRINSQSGIGAQSLFESVSEYIHAHYMEPLTVGMLAEMNKVNENRLFYVFQQYAQMGAGEYLRAYRLNKARELLITTSIPVGIIAEQVGYPDALYFSRVFKKRFGMTPTYYRGK